MSSTLQVCANNLIYFAYVDYNMTYCLYIYIYIFTLLGSKAVDSLLESKWATSEKLFTTRQEIETFLDLYDIFHVVL